MHRWSLEGYSHFEWAIHILERAFGQLRPEKACAECGSRLVPIESFRHFPRRKASAFQEEYDDAARVSNGVTVDGQGTLFIVIVITLLRARLILQRILHFWGQMRC